MGDNGKLADRLLPHRGELELSEHRVSHADTLAYAQKMAAEGFIATNQASEMAQGLAPISIVDRLRAPMQRITNHLLALAHAEPGKVIELAVHQVR